MAKRAKVTDFGEFKRKVKPGSPTCTLGQLLGMMKPLKVPSEAEILAEMKASADPKVREYAEAIERREKGENVDLRKFSDL